MTVHEIDPRDRTTILVHYYRAMVGRADIWRTRMDTSTNWAIGATAAVISFTLGNPAVPHYVLFIATLMTIIFLMLEARRLTFYHLWQQRVLLLEDGLIRPALQRVAVDDDSPDSLEHALEPHLGRTAPSMSLSKAAARRLRRVYLYLFGVQSLAWSFKVSAHPAPAGSAQEWLANAHAGAVPGELVAAIVAVLFAAAVVIALARGGTTRTP